MQLVRWRGDGVWETVRRHNVKITCTSQGKEEQRERRGRKRERNSERQRQRERERERYLTFIKRKFNCVFNGLKICNRDTGHFKF